MDDLVEKLGAMSVLSELPKPLLSELVADAEVQVGLPGDGVAVRPVDYFFLLEGSVELVRREDGRRIAVLSVPKSGGQIAWLYSVTAQGKLRVAAPARFVVLDGERIDAALSDMQTESSPAALSHETSVRVKWMRHSQPFSQMPVEQIAACASAMDSQEVRSGTDIVRQGEPGDYYYIIEDGEVEVWRAHGQGGDKAILVATLGPGDTFGEEALLQDGPRNATVRATRPCRLLRLAKADFNRLIRDQLLEEVSPDEAQKRLKAGKATLIDCRYEVEYNFARIAGARLMPLEEIRERGRGLDASKTYLVYCRSGRLSRAAAFLLKELGLNAASIKGGITGWPFDVEGDPAAH